ncbi:MAG TPA: hypothetical protein VHP14_18275, partial [Anaerolineales bacterium]|nr:hypothetical protein [Anaerolineales bacterium]
LVLSIFLSIFALIARNEAKASQALALTNESRAIQQQNTAVAAQATAEENEKIAKEKKKEAEEKTNLAKANSSAARSQIFQGRAGELDTSTLLAIDSYQRVYSFEAEDLIRVNASRMAMPVKQMSQGGWISHIEWAPDYQRFVTSNKLNSAKSASIGEACVWQASDGKKVYCVQHENHVNDALFTKDGKYLVTASSDKTVRFWDAASGKEIREKRLTFDGAVNDLDVSQSILAIAREDGFLTIYYLNSPDLKPVHREQDSSVWAVRFSPGGELLAFVTTNGDVRFWNAKNSVF